MSPHYTPYTNTCPAAQKHDKLIKKQLPNNLLKDPL